MHPKDKFISAVRTANISKEGWLEDCLPILDDLQFACGYLARLQDELGEQLSDSTEDYREAILETEDYDIWK